MTVRLSRLLPAGCAAIVCALSVAGRASGGANLDIEWRRYYNPQWNYCVSYPAQWSKGDAFEGAGLFVRSGVKKHSRPVGEIDVSVVPEEIRARAITLNDEVRDHILGLQRFTRAEKLELLERRDVVLSGIPALLAKDRFYDPQDGSTWVNELVLARDGAALYRVELECKASEIERFESVFARVASTFKTDCK
jgi:hypothetical protein